ncbi:hypothetical protein Y032_0178g640 [Ancylostoma ceylanicum]|uniref:Uncharacterized protein n=1 Tax=Ancylostoma ceylanicum TaxID=53326 RepID=A0A016SSV7_9BILA|nr:hypothetical protein Y032_0178g640 [Ancylostoma ceylanicum]
MIRIDPRRNLTDGDRYVSFLIGIRKLMMRCFGMNYDQVPSGEKRCDYEVHASICERSSMKTGQRGMKFSMKRKCGGREAVNACDCYATAMRLDDILHHIDACASVARIQYKFPFNRRNQPRLS